MLLISFGAPIHAQDDRGATAPFLRIEANGPSAYVTALGFRVDPVEKKLVLHAAGWDKTVHAWSIAAARDDWKYDARGSLRVPIGPAHFGSANAMAISPDGQWIAVGGRGFVRGFLSQEIQNGLIWPASTALTDDMRLDMGTIFVFHAPTGEVRRLRGHAGTVLALTFANSGNLPLDADPVLVSAALEQTSGIEEGKIRVWDVRGGQQLSLLNGMPHENVRPSLVAWRNGAAPKAIRIGIAWRSSDSKASALRIWDAGQDKPVDVPVAGPLAAICLLPGSEPRLLTGALGEIGVWTVPTRNDANPPQLDLSRDYRPVKLFDVEELNGQKGYKQLLMAVAPIPSPSGPAKQVAGIVYSQASNSYRLMVVNVDTGKTDFESLLWENKSKPPALAVDPRGQFIAISGNEKHEVWVYRTDDLQNKPQILSNVSQPVGFVAFAKKDDRVGIVVGADEPRKRKVSGQTLQAEDRVYDVAQRRLGSQSGWGVFNSDDSDWSLTESKGQPVPRLEVARGRQPKTLVELSDGDRVETWSGCQASPVFGSPLLAVAINNSKAGDTQLWLFDAEKGTRLRQLNGHVDRITSLAFSRDGKFLVSASIDRTFRIWGLSDLKESLRANGGLTGLQVQVNKEGQVVVATDRSSRFVQGDVLSIPAVGRSEKLLKFTAPDQFYRYLADRKPGDRLSVQVTRNGQTRGAELVIEPCIDERKPLCSVFLFKERAGDPEGWICWDPLGRYDSPSGESETRLGWHFNTDDDKSPVRFAPADKYREQNYWEGLIADHMKQGAELTPRPKPEPKTSLFLREGKQILKAVTGQPIIAREGSLSAILQIAAFPERLIDRVTWSVDGKDQDFRKNAAGFWEANLDSMTRTRSVSTLAASIKTREKPARIFVRELSFQSISEPPSLTITPELPKSVDQEQLEFDVHIDSSVLRRSESVLLTVSHFHEGREAGVQKLRVSDTKPQHQKLQLRSGENVVTVAATNESALPESISLEETRRTFVIRLAEAQRPEIHLLGIEKTPGEPLVAIKDPKLPWITDRRNVKVHGKLAVKAPDSLVRAQYSLSGNRNAVALEGFKTGASFEFSQSIPIDQPGLQTVTFLTESNRGMVDQVSFDVRFEPALPEVEKYSFAHPSGPLPTDGILVEGRHEPKILVKARIVPPAKELLFNQPVSVILRSKSKAGADFEKVIDFSSVDAQSIEEALPLRHGKNELQMLLRSKSADKQTLKVVFNERLEYRQPPKIVEMMLPKESKQPTVTMEADVVSSSPLKQIRVLLNGFDMPPEALTPPEAPEKDDHWKVKCPISLDLYRQLNTVELWVRNQDGECLQPQSRQCTYIEPPPPIAEIIREFPSSINTNDPNYEIQFRIRSETPLQAVNIELDRGSERSIEVPIDSLPEPDANGYVAFKYRMSVSQFDEAAFKFAITAINSGGTARTPAAELNFMMTPLRLVIDDVCPVGGHSLARSGSSAEQFAASPTSRLEVKGRLTGSVGKANLVKIWVNGFLQRKAPVEDDGTFSSVIALNLPASNRITFEVPKGNVPLDTLRLPKLVLDCQSHERPSRLRLITAVAGGQNSPSNTDRSKKLEDRLLNALRAQRDDNGGLPAIGGFKVESTYVMDDDFDEYDLVGRLVELAQLMNANDGLPSNDVLVMYYQGREVRRDGMDFELETGNHWYTLKRQTMVDQFGEIQGAHLLLLDVEGRAANASSGAWSDPHLGLFRVAWSDQPKAGASALRLVDAVDSSVRKPVKPQLRLKKMAELLEQAYNEIRREFPAVTFNSAVPEDLEYLVLTP